MKTLGEWSPRRSTSRIGSLHKDLQLMLLPPPSPPPPLPRPPPQLPPLRRLPPLPLLLPMPSRFDMCAEGFAVHRLL